MTENPLEVQSPAEGNPARGYSWAPFTGPDGDNPGWLASLRNGIYSDKTLDPLAAEVAEMILRDAPELAAPRFRFALTSWAHAEARAALIRFWLGQLDVIDVGTGEPRDRWLRELRAEERLAGEMRRELGLTPQSYARLEKEVSDALKGKVDIERLVREGEVIRLEAEKRLAPQRAARAAAVEAESTEEPPDA